MLCKSKQLGLVSEVEAEDGGVVVVVVVVRLVVNDEKGKRGIPVLIQVPVPVPVSIGACRIKSLIVVIAVIVHCRWTLPGWLISP